jgi:hypothetical protein
VLSALLHLRHHPSKSKGNGSLNGRRCGDCTTPESTPDLPFRERERDPPCPGEVNHPADILTNFITIKPTNIQIHIARLSTIYTVSNIASITGYKQEIRCDPSLFRQPYIPFLKSGEVRGNARASLRIDSNAHICASRML